MISTPHSALLCHIARNATRYPDKLALVGTDYHITYGQLVANIEAAAAFLLASGLKPGDRVILAAQKELQFVYFYFAAHLLGIINVVVDSTSPIDRLEYIISVVRPSLLLGNGLDINGLRCMSFGCLDDGYLGRKHIEYPCVEATDVADVMFTTGTTGVPKGVCLSHANLAGSAHNTNAFIGTSETDVEALALPLSHSFGLGRLRCVLTAGATLVLVSNFANLKTFFSVLQTHHVTGFGMVPAVWQYIKRISGRRISVFAGQLRYIEIGSAALAVEDKRLLMEMFPQTRLCMHYGLTEASRAMFTEFHSAADNLDTVGRPATDLVEAMIADNQGKPVSDGVDGEVCVRGNMVTCSYYLPQDNQGAFFGDWFRTGDWGHRDKKGNYYLTGRMKELINVGGEKVSPVTIETAIKSLGVVDCACIAVPDPNGVLGEVPKVFVQRGGDMQDLDELKRCVGKLLPAHEVPVLWEWIDHIPYTASGKIQRLKLK